MLRIFLRLLFVAALAGAAFLIWRAISRYGLDALIDSLTQIPKARLGAAIAFAASSYFCLTIFDWLALRYAHKPLAWPKAALASFASLSIGHTVGLSALSSGAIRYRYYSRWGLRTGDVAKVILFSGMTVGLGLATLGGIGLILFPAEAEGLIGMHGTMLLLFAAACLAVPVAYLVLCIFVRGTLQVRKWRLELPEWRLALAQIGIGTLNYALVAACLHQLLSALSEVAYLKTAAIYVISQTAALVSHVPGGLGVLEATVLYLMRGDEGIGALLAFRCVYFFLPLFLGMVLFFATAVAPSRLASSGASERAPAE